MLHELRYGLSRCPRCGSSVYYDRSEKEWRCLCCNRSFVGQGVVSLQAPNVKPRHKLPASVPDRDGLEDMEP